MTKTGNSERTTIPAKERTAKDHAKAVGNGLLGVGEALLELLLQPTVLVESALLMVINHNKHNLFPKWMKKREGN